MLALIRRPWSVERVAPSPREGRGANETSYPDTRTPRALAGFAAQNRHRALREYGNRRLDVHWLRGPRKTVDDSQAPERMPMEGALHSN